MKAIRSAASISLLAGLQLLLSSCQTPRGGTGGIPAGSGKESVRTAGMITISLAAWPSGPYAGKLSVNALKGTFQDVSLSFPDYSEQKGIAMTIDSASAMGFYSQVTAESPPVSNQNLFLRLEQDMDPNEPMAWGLQLVNTGSNGSDRFTFRVTVPGASEQQFSIAPNTEAFLTYSKTGALKVLKGKRR